MSRIRDKDAPTSRVKIAYYKTWPGLAWPHWPSLPSKLAWPQFWPQRLPPKNVWPGFKNLAWPQIWSFELCLASFLFKQVYIYLILIGFVDRFDWILILT